MKKTLAIITLLIIISLTTIMLFSKTVQECYSYCRKYKEYKEFVACMDGCLH
jgi:hypothetical protein